MAILITDEVTERLILQLAEIKKISPAEAVLMAVKNELARTPLRERIRPIQDRVASWPGTGLKADKAFYDSLNDE